MQSLMYPKFKLFACMHISVIIRVHVYLHMCRILYVHMLVNVCVYTPKTKNKRTYIDLGEKKQRIFESEHFKKFQQMRQSWTDEPKQLKKSGRSQTKKQIHGICLRATNGERRRVERPDWRVNGWKCAGLRKGTSLKEQTSQEISGKWAKGFL